MELHSRYLTAPHFLAHFLPLAVLTQSFVMSTTEWRKSVCVPTMKKGVSGLNCLISGIHFNFTFSNESLSYTEKQTTNTSVSEYASVRRRSYVSCKRNQLKINKNVLHIFFSKENLYYQFVLAKAQRIHICRQFEIIVYFWLDVCSVELFSPAYLSSCVQHTQLMRVLSFLNIN